MNIRGKGKKNRHNIFILVCLTQQTTSSSQSTNWVPLSRLMFRSIIQVFFGHVAALS